MFARFMFTMIGGFILYVMVGTFVYNLPDWCAHPERPGNAALQDTMLCKR